eukprot:9473859-Pyramimonas_sp.AAC.1
MSSRGPPRAPSNASRWGRWARGGWDICSGPGPGVLTHAALMITYSVDFRSVRIARQRPRDENLPGAPAEGLSRPPQPTSIGLQCGRPQRERLGTLRGPRGPAAGAVKQLSCWSRLARCCHPNLRC